LRLGQVVKLHHRSAPLGGSFARLSATDAPAIFGGSAIIHRLE
jgi:hypothetical protein